MAHFENHIPANSSRTNCKPLPVLKCFERTELVDKMKAYFMVMANTKIESRSLFLWRGKSLTLRAFHLNWNTMDSEWCLFRFPKAGSRQCSSDAPTPIPIRRERERERERERKREEIRKLNRNLATKDFFYSSLSVSNDSLIFGGCISEILNIPFACSLRHDLWFQTVLFPVCVQESDSDALSFNPFERVPELFTQRCAGPGLCTIYLS